jgi:outer membrane protein assembly factor BamB
MIKYKENEKNMKFAANKSKTILTSLFLALTIAVTLVSIPVIYAHDPPWTISTDLFVNVAPNPVGVGQTAYVNVWLDKVPPTATGPWGMRWHDITVEVTKPDGAIETLGPYDSDSVGGVWTTYTPDQLGTYTFQASFPGQVVTVENPLPTRPTYQSEFINDTYTNSISEKVELIVQEESIETAFPFTPLPTEYWARPISSMNREWYSLGGNWLGLRAGYFGTTGMYNSNGNFNPYTQAPNSAHVMWTEPIAFGGQIGGEFGPDETSLYATGTAYESKFGAVIMYGVLYRTEYPGAGNNPTGLKAVDLRTGETLWRKNITTPLKCGMIYNFITGNQYGGHAYLFCAPARAGFVSIGGPYWEMYDAMTGEWILNIANASAGTLVAGENGEILSYTVREGMLSLWNMSKCIAASQPFTFIYSPAEIWRPPQGATIDWNDGYEWSVPVATEISGVPISPALGIYGISDDAIFLSVSDVSTPGNFQTGWRVDAGYSAIDGRLLWGPTNRTFTPWTAQGKNYVTGEGVYAIYTRNSRTWDVYDIKTGQKLWTTEPKNSTWSYYDIYGNGIIGYGNLYTWGIGGEAYCYDVQTGETKWGWNAGNSGVDTPYGVWPLGTFYDASILADGKLYVRAGHDYTPPVFRGAKLYCLNATTGEEVWSSLSFNIVGTPACADGYMVWFNGYDNQIYCYGKGPSATTVTIQDDIIVHGESVLVKGMVTDESSGAKEYVQTARFPHGVPAISDEDQSEWMEYLYQQQPMPQDATGVDVTMTVLDPNNNCYDVATAVSDASGTFCGEFTPEVPGLYKVIATFDGSDSYWPSQAVTYLKVEEAPAATAEPTPPPADMTDTYVTGFGIGMIITIVAIGLVLILMLRKR